jgi:hypothetical protein
LNNFQKQLEIGKVGESYIAKWFQKKGYNVLPVYEKEISEGKGPVLFTATLQKLISPDMLAFKGEKIYWVEVKHKSAFSWHRITGRWVTGIDLKHYNDYLEIAKTVFVWPVLLMFLHKDGIAKDTPRGMVGPTGLFGENILFLSENENHRSDKWGKSGMVYWSHETLKKLEEYIP